MFAKRQAEHSPKKIIITNYFVVFRTPSNEKMTLNTASD